jgi:hypothetical protein
MEAHPLIWSRSEEMCSLCNFVKTREDLAHNVHLLDRYSDVALDVEVEPDPGSYNLRDKFIGQQTADNHKWIENSNVRSEEEA